MVDYSLYGFCRWLWRVQRVQPLWLIGEFSAACNAARKIPHKLWYFPLVNIRTAASVLTPYIFSPRFSVVASSALRIGLALLLHRLCRLGQGLTAQVVVQVLILTIVYGLVGRRSPNLACRCSQAVRPAVSLAKQPIGNSQPICPPPLRDWKRSSR